MEDKVTVSTAGKKLPLFVLFISIVYILIHVFNFPLIHEIEYSSVFSEGLIAVITLAGIFLLNVQDKKIYTVMTIGLILIFTAMCTDTLDEVYEQPNIITTLFEDLSLILGFIFINFGIYTWGKYSNDLNISLEKKVALEINKNKEKERIIFNQSKLSSMGEMIGSIAHQWRQPLNTLAIQLQFIEDDFEDGLVDKKYLNDFSKEKIFQR